MREQEDSVVLSREEYKMLDNEYKNLEIKYSNLFDKYRLCKDANETLKQNVITARKECLEAQNAEEIKILLVEDGSIDVDDLAMFIDEHNLKIKIVLYRQGSVPPRFLKQSEVKE